MNAKRTILIVDDEQPTISALELLLSENFRLLIARSGEQALEILQKQTVDLVFLDITLQGMDGFQALKEIKRLDESLDVIMLTADERAKTAMRALEFGAFYYITKPFDSEEILLIARRAMEKRSLQDEIVSLKDDVQTLSSFQNMIGRDPKMREIFRIIETVSETDSTVLITGESGTGKELVAKAIHYHSPRREKCFKAINCGAIPEHLLESELFGHEKGAFTGAVEKKIGKFEMADGGTLFLDEISSMKELMQVKLLRVLQEHEIERVGGVRAIPVDARIIAATNANLRGLVERGLFREDLFFRLNVIHIHLPPLRERKGDIIFLADYFLKHYAAKFRKKVHGFSAQAAALLDAYSWPGNVRELKNVIERAVVLGTGEIIRKEELPADLAISSCRPEIISEPFALKDIMDQFEKKVILTMLERVGWNQTRAAELLDIHRNTLITKLEFHGIKVKALKETQENEIVS